MKKVLLLCTVLTAFIFPQLTFAQGFPWLVNIEGGSTFAPPEPLAVAYDSSGFIYVTGFFDNQASIGSTALSGTNGEGFLAKFDTAGVLIWVETFGGTGEDAGLDVVTDHQGGVYVSGFYQGTASFDTISVTSTISNSTFRGENFLVKYNASGAALWIRKGSNIGSSFNPQNAPSSLDYRNGTILYAAQYQAFFNSIAADRTFNGTTFPANSGTSSATNFFVSTFQPNGTQTMLQPILGEATFSASAILQDAGLAPGGEVFALALGFDSIVVGSSVITNPSSLTNQRYNALIKLNASGVYQGANLLGDIGFSSFSINQITVSNSGTVYVGSFRNTSTTPILAGVTLPASGSFIYKVNGSNLNTFAASVVSNGSGFAGSSTISGLVLDTQGNLFIGGAVDGGVTVAGTALNAQRELFFAKCDTSFSSSSYLTRTIKPGSGNFQVPSLSHACLGSNDEIYITGNVVASSTVFGSQTTTANSNTSGFVTRIVDCLPLSVTATPANAVICGNAASVNLSATNNPAYNYQWLASGSPVAGATNPTFAATNQGTYSAEVDSLGCLDTSNTVTVTQEPLPAVSVPSTTLTVCNIAAPFVLQGGQPAGGVWSGTGVVNDTIFDPSIVGSGPVLLTYTYTTPSGCANDAVRIANVVAPATLTVSNNIPSFCEGDPAFSLTSIVNPSGGTYSGPGVINNLFYPDSAGVGTHTITYNYAVITGCTSTVTFNIVVNAAPSINFPAFSPVCNSTFSIPLNTATPTGGTYTGNFTISNTFYPFLSGAGNFPVIYTVTQNGCTASDTQAIQVDAPVTPTLAQIGPFCAGDAAINLTQGSPAGGTYLINGTPSATFDPVALGVGSYTVQYAFTNACGTDTATQTVTVNPIPTVTLSAFGPYCENDASVALTQGSPAGGVYSGSGVVGGDFVPSQAQIGANQIIYTFTGAGGCSASDTTSVTVFAKPIITMSLADTLCIDNGSYTLTASPTGGSFTGPGVSGNSFDPQLAGVGSHIISYTVTNANNCSDTLTDTIEVIVPVTVTLNPFTPVCEGDAAFMLSGGSPQGGSYSGTGVAAGMFDPAISGAGTFDIVYTFSTACGLRADTQQIVVNPAPTVTLPVLTDVCVDANPINLPQGTPVGGTYSGTAVIGSQFYPGTAGVGIFDVVYAFTGVNGCSAADTQQITVNPLPTVTLAPLADVCIDAGLVTLTGGMPMGGTYSGSGVTGGQFDASIAGLGTHTITYTYSDGNGCSDTAQRTITVNDLPTVTWNALANVCANDAAITLTGGLPTGGTYSGPGVSAGQFNPQSVGPGTYTLVYTFADANGCADSATETITVDPLPAVSLAPFAAVCIDNGVITLTGGLPAGGTYSGTGVIGGQFDPQAVGPGTYDIIYTVTGTTCNASDTQQLVVNPLPNVTLPAFADACIDAGTITLTGGSPLGGTYSGTGVTAGVFDPQVAGLGSTLITYTFTDANGCTSSDTASINVNSGPTVTLSAFADLCANDAPITLSGGMPMGGSYSGVGVSGGIFNPQVAGPGSHTITYVYTAPTGCADSATATITVNPLPLVTLSALPDVCVDAGPVTLSGGLPTGGIYTGTAVTAGQFDPQAAGVGTHDVVYTFTNAQGCTASDTQQIVVNDLPVLSINVPSQICIDGGVITLSSGTPSGGTYSGTGVTAGQFDPQVAGVGSHVITYNYTDGNGCSNSITDTILVDPLPTVSLATFTNVCENDAAFALTGGIPAGGTYTGTGVTGGQFDPSLAGSGTFLITYTFTDANGCSNSDTASITVNPAPTVSLSGLGDVCLDGGLVTLSGGLPVGGTYSGTGVSGGQFNPLVAGVGQHVITYTFTSSLGCTSSATDTIEVSTPPAVSLAPLADVCIDAGAITLSGGLPAGGTYSGSGVTAGVFDPLAVGVGTHSIIYSFTNAQGCSASDTQSIVVNDLPVVDFPLSLVVCDYAAPVTLSAGTPVGGSYSGPGVTGSQFDPSVTGQGTFDVVYAFTDGNGCSASDTGSITVSPRPNVSLGPDRNICEGQDAVLTASGASTYLWSTTETTNSIVITPTMNSTYTVTGTDANGCEGFDTIDVIVNPIPVVNLPNIDTVCADTVFTLDAGAGFTQYRWNTGALVQSISVGPFTPNTTQTYWVLVEDALRCTGGDSVSFYVEDCGANFIGDLEETGTVKLYPNPNQGRFVLEASQLQGETSIQIVSVTGSIVYTSESGILPAEWRQEINLGDYGNGMYTVVVTAGDKVYRKPFMINR